LLAVSEIFFRALSTASKTVLVVPAGDGDAANARRIVARVESEPASIGKDFKPRVIVHRGRVWRHANVTQRSIRVTRRNIQAAAESDREMGEIAADADALLVITSFLYFARAAPEGAFRRVLKSWRPERFPMESPRVTRS
jgi:hypothetical protein